MSLHPGMRFKTKRSKKVCSVVESMGNEVAIKCGRKGQTRIVSREYLDNNAKWLP